MIRRRPDRPEGMETSIPDFSVYQPQYTITATVPTSRGPVTVTATLTQCKEPYTAWEWKNDELSGKRAGHTLRRGTAIWKLLNTTSIFLRRDAYEALRAAGWRQDDLLDDLWQAPMHVWAATLEHIR